MLVVSNLFIASVFPEDFAFSSYILESMVSFFFSFLFVVFTISMWGKKKTLYVYKCYLFFRCHHFGGEEVYFKNGR